jgi:hypothetical protein
MNDGETIMPSRKIIICRDSDRRFGKVIVGFSRNLKFCSESPRAGFHAVWESHRGRLGIVGKSPVDESPAWENHRGNP